MNREPAMQNKPPSKDNYRAADLLQAGVDHLASARALFELHPRCFDSAGYLTHLGFELMFKAVLLHSTGRFPWEHSFPKLLNAMKSASVAFHFNDSQHQLLNRLDEFNELRYPVVNGSSSIGDLDWKEAEALFKWIAARLPDELRLYLQSVEHTIKFGRVLMRKPKAIKSLRPRR